MTSVRFEYAKLPESVNKLYIVRAGRKILSSEGRRYKNDFKLTMGGADRETFMEFEPVPDAPYILRLWFYLDFNRLYNVTYGSDKRVKSPFADIDTSNMIKLIEDCISELTGIRDRNNFSVLAHKRETQGTERVVAILEPLDLENDPYGFDR